MNWNVTPKKNVALVYISKNSDESEKGKMYAYAMQKTMNAIMQDMKKRGVLFTVKTLDGKTATCKAVVKSAPALDKTKGQEIIVNGQMITSYPPIMDSDGTQLFNVTATIYQGQQNLTIFGGKHIDGEGKINLSSIRWGLYDAKNPKNSLSAKGIDEIMMNDKATHEMKELVNALDISGVIRDFDVTYSQTKIDDYTIAAAAKKSVKPLVKLLKDKKAMPVLTSTAGVHYYGAAFIEVQKDVTRINKYWVKAGIRKGDETIYINMGDTINKDGFLPIFSISYQKFNSVCPSESIRVKQDEIQNHGEVSDEYKALASAIIDSGYLYENTELREYSYKLNMEYFKKIVNVQTDKGTEVKKVINASYNPERRREDGTDNTYPEQVTIFNRINPEILVILSDHDKYGHTAKAINTDLTEDENGIHKREQGESCAAGFLTDANDIVKFCPDSEELYHAICDWVGIDYNEIKRIIAPELNPNEFEEILSDG